MFATAVSLRFLISQRDYHLLKVLGLLGYVIFTNLKRDTNAKSNHTAET
jgi:hypothetical protein